MFDFTDPFGTRRIENLERELRRQKCAMQGDVDYYREKAIEQGAVSHHLCQIMERDYKALTETRKEKDRLAQMLKVCDDARKSLAEKNRDLANKMDLLSRRFDELTEQYDKQSDKLSAKERELDELYKEHEALIREIRDEQHTPAVQEQEAISA